MKELRGATVSELGHSHSQIGVKSLTDTGTIHLPAMTAQDSSNRVIYSDAADGEPRVGVTDDIVNLLCHFIGNGIIPHFWKCDDKHFFNKT